MSSAATVAMKVTLRRLLQRFRFMVSCGCVMLRDCSSLPIPQERLPTTLERLN